MIYTFGEWLHDLNDEPVRFYHELDDDRWEVRKVELYRDGRMQFADSTHKCGSTGLGLAEHPPMKEIAADPEFRYQEISHAEFEAIWRKAEAEGNNPPCR